MATISDLCTAAITSLRTEWTSRAAAEYMSRGGLTEQQATQAAEELWRTGDIDMEPEDCVVEDMNKAAKA